MKSLYHLALVGAAILTGCGGASTPATPAPVVTPGTLAVASATAAVSQPATAVAIMVNRTGGTSGTVSVSYATSNGTATSGTDYTATTGSVLWTDGDAAAKSITVPLTATPGFAGSRTFTLTLSSPTGNATLGAAATVVTITGSLIPPSNYFTLGGVKLQLPIDIYGGTGGTNNIQYAEAEVTSAQLTAGYASPYFYADATHRMVFYDPSNGAVSSPGSGSDHTRSELRELYTGTGADSNSDWNSAIGGTLTAACAVQSVSVNSDEATIAQIHNQSYVFILLLYRPATKDVAFDLYSTLGSSTHTRTSIVTGINLGDTITYSVKYTGNTATVVVNGTTKTFAVDPTWAGTPVYFKLGAYHAAPNIGNPAGDATQVAFSSFAITH